MHRTNIQRVRDIPHVGDGGYRAEAHSVARLWTPFRRGRRKLMPASGFKLVCLHRRQKRRGEFSARCHIIILHFLDISVILHLSPKVKSYLPSAAHSCKIKGITRRPWSPFYYGRTRRISYQQRPFRRQCMYEEASVEQLHFKSNGASIGRSPSPVRFLPRYSF